MKNKISVVDLRLLLQILPKLDDEFDSIRVMASSRKEQFFVKDHIKPSWHHLYEMPYQVHLAHVVTYLGLNEQLKHFALQDNPSQAVIASIAESVNDNSMEDFDAVEMVHLPLVFGWGTSLFLTLKSLMIYGVYLNDLVATAGSDTSDGYQAALHAIRIDPSTVACTNISLKISKAVITHDQKFLNKLKLSIGGNCTKREQKTYKNMRLVLQVLIEANAGRLTSSDLYDLFVEQLNIVSKDTNSDIGDVENNLRQFTYQFLKSKPVI